MPLVCHGPHDDDDLHLSFRALNFRPEPYETI